jgi:hypothetical protein
MKIILDIIQVPQDQTTIKEISLVMQLEPF